jgi:hypothetical protein
MKKKYLLLKSNKNINFLNSLIDSDFLILEKLSSNKNNRFLKSNLKLSNFKKKSFFLLNFFELIKMFHQMFRILQFFKNSKSPELFLNFKEENFVKVAHFYVKYNKNILPVKFKNNTSSFKNLSSFMILLNKIFNNKNDLKRLIDLNMLIFVQINSFVNKNNNVYKLFNNFDNYKKLIFFLIFLKKFYSKNTKKKLCV